MFCTTSLGRVGLDFSDLVLPSFRNRILLLFSRQCSESLLSYKAAFHQYQWKMDASMLSKLGLNVSDTADEFQPPFSLLAFPPLAVACNGLITAINELRPFVPSPLLQLHIPVLEVFKEFFLQMAEVLRELNLAETALINVRQEIACV